MIKFTEQYTGWKVHIKKDTQNGYCFALCILPDDKVLGAQRYSFQLYTSSLDRLNKIEFFNIVGGLNSTTQFKPLVHQEDAEYVMISNIYGWNIEEKGLKHVVHKGQCGGY